MVSCYEVLLDAKLSDRERKVRMMTKTFSVRLPGETYDQLVENAERLGLSPAVLARAYIKFCLNHRPDVIQLANVQAEEPPVSAQTTSRKNKNSKKKKR